MNNYANLKYGHFGQKDRPYGLNFRRIVWMILVVLINLNNQSVIALDTMVSQQEKKNLEKATFAAGCFWCVEAIFERVHGVTDVKSGYSGGHVKNPSYREVCNGTTGHAEVCQLTFDPDVISYIELLEIFWQTHDPTTLNRQGNDVGTQYRSAIFCHNTEQKRLAEEMKLRLNKEKIWANPVVTEIADFKEFYPAEDYHEDYYEKNPEQPYCSIVITPKIEKFEKVFSEYLKE